MEALGRGGKGKGKGLNGEKKPKAAERSIRMTHTCDRTRILPADENETHRLRITFDMPAGDRPEILLCLVGEDGSREQTTISAVNLVSPGGTGHTKDTIEIMEDRKGFRLLGANQGDRPSVEIGLLEPSQGQAYELVWRDAAKSTAQ